MTRAIDHLVMPVRDLEAARALYAALGFLLTPVARHPWGTENSLVQFPGAFLELLAVADPTTIPEASGRFFSFGAFNRDFLAAREGISMLVLESADEAADRAAFAAAGLPVYDPFRFERQATRPDGSVRSVAFSLTFTSDVAMPEAGFFTCRQHFPENFWNPEVQRHPNGATGLAELVMVAPDPDDLRSFFARFTGGAPRAVDGGFAIDTGRGTVTVATPAGVEARLGPGLPTPPADTPRFAAVRLAGTTPDDMRRRIAGAGLQAVETPSGPSVSAFGIALVFG